MTANFIQVSCLDLVLSYEIAAQPTGFCRKCSNVTPYTRHGVTLFPILGVYHPQFYTFFSMRLRICFLLQHQH